MGGRRRSVVESGWWQPHLGGFEADTEVYGSSGYRRIWAREQPAGYVHCDLGLFVAQMRHSLGQVAAWRPGKRSPLHGLAALRICEQAYAAAGVPPPMPADRPLVVAGIAGSLRRGSFNRGLLRAAVESAPGGMTIETLEIRDLPLYDADLDVDGGPEVVRAFKAGILKADAAPDRHARIQLLDAGCAQERARLGLAGAGAGAQRQARRDRRARRPGAGARSAASWRCVRC